jgi:uncharacterized protein YeaO (DUF488 family)
MTTVRVRRVYDPPEDEGFRVLVDRLWPRGVPKEAAAIDLWAKVLTPSDDLRRWYHSHPEDGPEFAVRYLAELEAAPTDEVLDDLRDQSDIVLVTAVREPEHSHVPVLRAWLSERGLGDVRR